MILCHVGASIARPIYGSGRAMLAPTLVGTKPRVFLGCYDMICSIAIPQWANQAGMDGRLRLEIEENEAERGLVSLEKRKPVGVAWRFSKRPRSFPQTRRGLATVLHFRDFQVHGASPREKFFAQIFSKKAALRQVLAVYYVKET